MNVNSSNAAFRLVYLAEGEWQNGIPLGLTESGSPDGRDIPQDTEEIAYRQACDYLDSLTEAEVKRVKWIGVRSYMVDNDGTGESTGRPRLINPETQDWID
jgi:hypothetical protein